MQTYRIVSDTDDYLEHHGVKGQKWGVTRTPQQLGHKPKKTYEFKPYKTDFPTPLEVWGGLATPFRMISESTKRRRDPEYKRKSDEFIKQHKDELVRRFIHTGLSIPMVSIMYEMNFSSNLKKPETKKIMKDRMTAMKAENPDQSLDQIARRMGVSPKYLKQL